RAHFWPKKYFFAAQPAPTAAPIPPATVATPIMTPPTATLPPIHASAADVKAAPESEPIAVPVDAVPSNAAVEKIAAGKPAKPSLPAATRTSRSEVPGLSLRIASLTASQESAAMP